MEELAAGTVLFEVDDRGVDFFLVLQGFIEIYETGSSDGAPQVMTVHAAHQFTGELDLFTDRAILVGGRMGADGRVARLSRGQFRRMLAAEPDVAEIVMRAFILRRAAFISHGHAAVTLVGSRRSADTLRLQRFLTRNGHPVHTLEPGTDPDADARLDAAGLGPDHASEGLRTVVLESEAPGGQAGTSSRIENYLGFPTGVSGQTLAERAQVQAQKFGGRIAVPRQAVALRAGEGGYAVELDDGAVLRARTVVLATGARYRRLDQLDGFDRFEGGGIHYAATAMEAGLVEGEEAVVVGGGNSAGQAAIFLSRAASHVHVLVRGESLAASMSEYLVSRIDAVPERITLHRNTEITALHGDRHLEHVTWTNRATGEEHTRRVAGIFLILGAAPNTEWLDGAIALDARGFVLTGAAAGGEALPLATSLPGVFAVGDVRAGSIKRVASAVGEGSVVISAVHEALHAG